MEMNSGNLTVYGAYGGLHVINHAELNGGVVNARGGAGEVIFSARDYYTNANINLNGSILNISSRNHVNLYLGASGQFTITPGLTYFDDNGKIYRGNMWNEVRNIPFNTNIYPNVTHDINITSTGGNDKNYAFSASKKACNGEEVEIIAMLENYIPTDNSIMVKSVTVNGQKIANRNGHYKFNTAVTTAVTENITLTAKWYQNIIINETDINGITTPNIVNRETFEEYSVPNAPYLDGYEFEGWTVNNGESVKDASEVKTAVEALVSTDTEIAVAVSYKKLEKTHTVSLNGIGCNIRNADGETKDTYQVSEQLYATADKESADQKFSHWEINGVKVGYETTYAFRMPDKDMTLSAVYVDKETEVEKKGTAYIESVKKTGENQLSFVSVVSVPRGARILKAGVVAAMAGSFEGGILSSRIH